MPTNTAFRATVACIVLAGAMSLLLAADSPPILHGRIDAPEVIQTKLTVSDLRKSYDFYTKVLGLKAISWPSIPQPVFDDPEVAFTEACLNFSGSAVHAYVCLVKKEGVVATPDQAKLTSIGLRVVDARAAIERVGTAGFTVLSQPREAMGWVSGSIRDPDGYVVQVLQARTIPAAARSPSDTTTPNTQAEDLKARIVYLEDRDRIHDVYLRYMRGFDRNDVELLRSAFWPDVQINYGAQSNSLNDFLAKHLNRHTGELASWGHLLTNVSIEVSGDVAHVEAYVTGLFNPIKSDFAQGATIIAGRYIDRKSVV